MTQLNPLLSNLSMQGPHLLFSPLTPHFKKFCLRGLQYISPGNQRFLSVIPSSRSTHGQNITETCHGYGWHLVPL